MWECLQAFLTLSIKHFLFMKVSGKEVSSCDWRIQKHFRSFGYYLIKKIMDSHAMGLLLFNDRLNYHCGLRSHHYISVLFHWIYFWT